ncbi:MAG: serine hydrolase [Ruminococcaceae bacterium]|nr:serine hydrolase [Oscillospiraceae bacterium]
MLASQQSRLQRASFPEEVGVDSAVLQNFFDDLKESGYGFKNIMIGRHGKIVAECTKYPYPQHMPHTMFSMSKPVTAIAIGFAVHEGLLRLDTTLGQLFGDTYSEKTLRKVKDITVRHLLTMTAGIFPSVIENKEKGEWLENFFKSHRAAKPDKRFKYISENTYVLGRMLAKVSGQTISEYLRPRLFEPLGIDFTFWEKDKLGFDGGGWGLYLTIEDMAKLSQCLLQNGEFNGIQVIPAEWVKEMTTPHRHDMYGLDSQNLGYGYNVWCGREDGYYRLEGFYSQFAFLYPRENAFFVITCGDITHKTVYDLVDKHFPGAFKDNLTPPSEEVTEKLRETINSFSYNILPVAPRNFEIEKAVSGNTYRTFPNKNNTMLPISAVFMLASKPSYLNNIKFAFNEKYGELFWEEKNAGENKICINFDGTRRMSKVMFGDMPVHILAYGAWQPDSTLKVQMFFIEIPEVRTWVVRFGKNKINVRSSLWPNLYKMLDNKYRFEGFRTNVVLDTVAKLANSVGNLIFVPPRFSGRLTDKK